MICNGTRAEAGGSAVSHRIPRTAAFTLDIDHWISVTFRRVSIYAFIFIILIHSCVCVCVCVNSHDLPCGDNNVNTHLHYVDQPTCGDKNTVPIMFRTHFRSNFWSFYFLIDCLDKLSQLPHIIMFMTACI